MSDENSPIDQRDAELERLRSVLRYIGGWPDSALGHYNVAEDMRRMAREAVGRHLRAVQ